MVSLCGGVLILLASGCSSLVFEPEYRFLPLEQPYQYNDLDWAQVLQRHVRGGRMDYAALAGNRDPFDRYFALLSVTGPTATPEQFATREQRTAYWLNAFNALVVRAVLHWYPIGTMYDMNMPRLESDYRFRIDGRVLTLLTIEEEIFKESGNDARIYLATSRAALGTPGLLPEPFRASTLERQLTAAAAEALDNPNLLQVDHTRRTILLGQVILGRQADFVNFLRSRRRGSTLYLYNVLVELASPTQRRLLQGAVGYALREIPFDRRLNDTAIPTEPSVVP